MTGEAELVAHALGGKRNGAGWLCPCPAHQDRTPSLSVRDGQNGRLLLTCFAGCAFDEVLAELRARGILPKRGERPLPRRDSRPDPEAEADLQRRVEAAWSIFDGTDDIRGTLGERYLIEHRGITVTRDPATDPYLLDRLRFHPVCPFKGGTAPAVVAAVTGPSGYLRGIWRIRLDGFGRKVGRFGLGDCRGGAVRSVPALNDDHIAVAEGVEDALAFMQIAKIPTWAGCSTSGVAGMVLPPRFRRVTIVADDDPPKRRPNGSTFFPGVEAARKFASRLKAEGRAVRIIRPPHGLQRRQRGATGGSGGMSAFEDDLPPGWDEVPPEGAPSNASANAEWPGPLDLAALAIQHPQPPRFILPDWLPCGYGTMLAGHGGAGKSYIALALAVHIAAGVSWCGLAVQRRRVQYLSCEDRQSVLHWRLRHICDHLGVEMAALAGWLDVRDLVGHDTIVWQPDVEGFTTPVYDTLAAQFRQSGAQVLVIDGVTDVFGGDENSRWQVKSFVNVLLALIDPNEGALLLQAHVNKMSASTNGTTEGYSGSTAWHNAVRARWYLHHETDQDEDGKQQRTGALSLELQKSNLGRADQTITFRWNDEARLFVGEAKAGGALHASIAANRDREERESILAAIGAVIKRGDHVPAATTGNRTAYHVLAASGQLSQTLIGATANRRRFWRHIEHLRSMRAIRDGSIRRTDRKLTATLELETQ